MVQPSRRTRISQPNTVVTTPPSLPLSEGIVLVSMILLVLTSPFLYDLALAFGIAR